MNYDLHPLCTLFPRMSGAEFSALVEDIRANGLRTPITLHDGLILDGGNRYRACIEAGIEPTFAQFDGASLVGFVLSANLRRRHMTAGQQAAIVASAQDWAKAQSHGGNRKSDQVDTCPLETIAGRAAASGVSTKTQQRADKVAKADPELAKAVGHGDVPLTDAVAQVEGKLEPAPKPKPKLLTEEKSTKILAASEKAKAAAEKAKAEMEAANAECERLREAAEMLAKDSSETLADNESMAKIFESDDKLAAAMAEIKRLRAEVESQKWQINEAVNKANETIRRLKASQALVAKLETRLKAAGIAA